MSTEFKWDDNNVMEFAIKWLNQSVDWAIKHDYAAAPSPIQIELQQFKASKQLKQDWEIISLKNDGDIYKLIVDQTYMSGAHTVSLKWALENKFQIHSVKRLSDETIFTIGDKVSDTTYSVNLSITDFVIDNACLRIQCRPLASKWHINEIQKVQSLFTTEDGCPAYENYKVALLSTDNWLISYPVTAPQIPFKGDHNQFKYFSTIEKAEEWVYLNKKSISINDLKELLGTRDFIGTTFLFELLKDKLNKP